ncbi:HupE/UreJ family protein [Kovacikia minuta CCNUW1]|uniref:HupE/UreJ family protein n=1 Tax=Kovacikia minuta TaxID=2931930 RepID=UPI001CCD5F2F|nr:HupE/UreJ family protein [Kovacikia minuta]UBF26515.1 HupE/UreJ family protein [Kovacikia minuta CCNUW1]
MNTFKVSRWVRSNNLLHQVGLLVVPVFALLFVTTPALAHHAMGGRMPSSFFEGFISGIAHPLIGPDHFAFIVAIGLLAVARRQGILIPVAFVLAAMVGTGLHLLQLSIPGVELFVSGSILVFGILLAMKESLGTGWVIGLSAVAGLFHGYAYGESIFGAEMTPLFAYLAGFTVIQLVVSLGAFWVGKAIVFSQGSESQPKSDRLRSAGLVICGVGLAFFVSQVVNILFPVPHA